jgi:hypothetical protein
MNISHTQKNDQQSDYELFYIKTLNAIKQSTIEAKSHALAQEKALVLLGSSTPNYVLGYN